MVTGNVGTTSLFWWEVDIESCIGWWPQKGNYLDACVMGRIKEWTTWSRMTQRDKLVTTCICKEALVNKIDLL